MFPRYCSVGQSHTDSSCQKPVEERLKVSQKLPPSPLPSELLRAASYARRRRGFGAGVGRLV